MTEIFRSRGISIQKYSPYQIRKKTYWDLVSAHLNSPWITSLENNGVLTSFEKAQTNSEITAINFHVALCKDYSGIFIPASNLCHQSIKKISLCFGENYRPYTLGVRLSGDMVRAISYYYYPTIWKETRYGICGDADRKNFTNGIKKFADAMNISYIGELQSFIQAAIKFKGLSITEDNGQFSYKLYAKVDEQLFLMHLEQHLPEAYKKIKTTINDKIVLSAIRIENNQIEGYNYYFLTP